jgi:alpha-1,2-mannosyltransferase
MALRAAMNKMDPETSVTRQAAPAACAVRFTRQLALFFFLNVALINGVLELTSPGGRDDTVLQQTGDVLRGKSGDDSWGPMAAAYAYLREPPGKPLYQEIFFDQGIKFQYPPSALFALEGMYLFGEERVRTDDETVFAGAPPINDILGGGFLAITALATAGLVEAGLRQAGAVSGSRTLAILRAAIVAGITLTFYPVMKAFTLGQIQLWINSIFALALLCWVLHRRIASGVLMGLICLMKPHFGLFMLWGALNREWRFVLACGVVCATGLIFSILAYGWMNHLDYLRVLSFMSERGESYFANQSINGLLNRLAGLSAPQLDNNVNFDAARFPAYSAWVYWTTLVSSAVILLTALVRRSSALHRGLAFAILAVSLTVASPIAWEHHYGVLLPAFGLVAATHAGRAAPLFLIVMSFIFVSNFIPAFNLLAATPYNFLQSYTLAGGIFFLLLMHRQLSEVQYTKQRSYNIG